jgi:hypothetical protein
MLYPSHCVDNSLTKTSTAAQFVRRVSEQMQSLQLLSLLLTGDPTRAEQCFIGAIDEYAELDGSFVDWGQLRARQAICRHAAEVMQPALNRADIRTGDCREGTIAMTGCSPFGGILSLDALERFVYVITVLEGQSDRDCADLLRCTDRDVMIGRTLAVTQLALTDRDLSWATETPQF